MPSEQGPIPCILRGETIPADLPVAFPMKALDGGEHLASDRRRPRSDLAGERVGTVIVPRDPTKGRLCDFPSA